MTHNTRYVEYKGERMSLTDAVRASGSIVSPHTAAARLKHGWPLLRALTLPAVSPKRFDDLRPLSRGPL